MATPKKREAAKDRKKAGVKAARGGAGQKKRPARKATPRREQQETQQVQPAQAVPVRDVMTRDVRILSPEATIKEAAENMREANIGAIPICEDGRLLGMITDRDIAVRAVAEGRNPEETRIREIMSEDILSCSEEQPVGEAAKLMQEKQVRRLPVVDQEQRVVGIVSLDDLATRAGEHGLSGKTLEEVATKPEMKV